MKLSGVLVSIITYIVNLRDYINATNCSMSN
jgi:hypothetical protein